MHAGPGSEATIKPGVVMPYTVNKMTAIMVVGSLTNTSMAIRCIRPYVDYNFFGIQEGSRQDNDLNIAGCRLVHTKAGASLLRDTASEQPLLCLQLFGSARE